MTIQDPSTMTKAEMIEALVKHHNQLLFKCQHGHTGYGHPNCYKNDKGLVYRIGFFDIESVDLKADWGFMLSYCIKEFDGPIIKNILRPDEVLNRKKRDKRLVRECCRDMKEFDCLVVYYGKDTGGRYQRHDIPFTRTRAEIWGLKCFPKEKELDIIDLYDTVKSKFKLKRNSMEYVCKQLKIPAKTTPHDASIWMDARDGQQRALNHILKHNVEDVITTELLWKRVYAYKKVRSHT